jgi:hypothetical protein
MKLNADLSVLSPCEMEVNSASNSQLMLNFLSGPGSQENIQVRKKARSWQEAILQLMKVTAIATVFVG